MTARFAKFFLLAPLLVLVLYYRDNTATFKGQRCTRETSEVIRNVHVISISISDSISDSTLALFGFLKQCFKL